MERTSAPAVRLECRLDYARHFVRYQVGRSFGSNSRTYQNDGSLEFDVSAKNEILLRSSDQGTISPRPIINR